MKKVLAAVCVMVMLLCSLSQAQAEILEPQSHRDWKSFIVTTQNVTLARMFTSDGQTLMVMDVGPGGRYSLHLIESVPEKERDSLILLDGLSLYGKMRVDRSTMYDVRFVLHSQGDALSAELVGDFHERLIAEARKGSRLRLKMDGEEPSYLTFSLMGFSEALNRCMELARIIEGMDPPDSDYFDEPSPDSWFDAPQDDETSFL